MNYSTHIIRDNDGFGYDPKRYTQWELLNGSIRSKIKQQRCLNCGREWDGESEVMFATFKEEPKLYWWHKNKFNIK